MARAEKYVPTHSAERIEVAAQKFDARKTEWDSTRPGMAVARLWRWLLKCCESGGCSGVRCCTRGNSCGKQASEKTPWSLTVVWY